MATSQHDQHEITRIVLSLFEPQPDCICTEESFEHLRVAVDLAVHFFFFLTDCTVPSQIPIEACLDEIRIDISARAEFINLLGLAVRRDLEPIRPESQWKPPASLPEFREEYFRSFAALSSTDITKQQRYLSLLQICRLLFIYYGTTFI